MYETIIHLLFETYSKFYEAAAAGLLIPGMILYIFPHFITFRENYVCVPELQASKQQQAKPELFYLVINLFMIFIFMCSSVFELTKIKN